MPLTSVIDKVVVSNRLARSQIDKGQSLRFSMITSGFGIVCVRHRDAHIP